MVLSAEKSEKLSNFLIEDKQRAYRLLELEPEKALEELNSYGLDLTVDEVKEFGEQLISLVNTDDELNEEALQSVSGGFMITAGVLAAAVALFAAGLSASVAIGIAVANKKGW